MNQYDMSKFEDAIIYATEMHRGKIRKMWGTPYILHPLEVADIIASITDDYEIITAGVLHDVVEDTDGTIEEITEKFGERVAFLVSSETEKRLTGEDPIESWKRRKEESIIELKNTNDLGVKILWLGDKLSNIRSIANMYRKYGQDIWSNFHQNDPEMHRWYYVSLAEELELELNKTGAFKEFIQHINFIWPGSFEASKERFKKYKEVSLEGCQLIGQGAMSKVYRYDDELAVKVYNKNNTYKDIEAENNRARRAFVMGIPTAISFGIVSVGDQFGTMFELLDSSSISELIANNPNYVEYYADVMADLAHTIHDIEVEDDTFPSFAETLEGWITKGIAYENKDLASKYLGMIKPLTDGVNSLIHGDFHTGNVMMPKGEPLLIDMDSLSKGHPIIELSCLYMSYVGFGEFDPSFLENFMGFSCETAGKFFDEFLRHYLDTDDEEKIQSVRDKAALLCYLRLVRRAYKKGILLSKEDAARRDYYMAKILELDKKVDSFEF